MQNNPPAQSKKGFTCAIAAGVIVMAPEVKISKQMGLTLVLMHSRLLTTRDMKSFFQQK